MNKLGYACINLTLESSKIRTNRTMTRKTFDTKGLNYVSQLAIKNIDDLETVIKWNIQNNIQAYRLPDDLFPWKSEYEYQDLPNYSLIVKKLQSIGDYCRKHNHRLSQHPGQFNILASNRDDVVKKTIRELNQHSKIFDMMGFNTDHNTKINIHVGAHYNDKIGTMNRFCENFYHLDTNCQKRLTVENDDKKGLYTIQDLMYIHNKINIPLVFDYFHHNIHNDGFGEKETLELAISTWPKDITPVVHFSSTKKIYEPVEKVKEQAHADYIYQKCETYGKDLIIILESKAKDLSIFKYRKDYESSERSLSL